MMTLYRSFLLAGLSGLLCACGGGNSSPTPPVSPAPTLNRAPIASATTSSATAPESSSVTLNASGSSDPDGDALSYQWVQLDGPTAEIVSPTAAQTQVNFGETDLDETATFQVTVSDGQVDDRTQVELTLQNSSDEPGPDGVLTLRTKGTPVAIVGNIRSRSENDAELMFIEADETGATSVMHYEIESADDGSIARGVPLRKTNGFQDFGADNKFFRGYDDSFFTIESDRVLLMHDPDYDPKDISGISDPAKIYGVGVEIPGEDACLITSRMFPNPFDDQTQTGYVIIGYRNGGLKLFSWPHDQPDNLTETVLDQTKSYCGLVEGRINGRLSTGFYSDNGFLDVDALIMDFYFILSPPLNSRDIIDPPPARMEHIRSVDLSTLGIQANAQYVESFGDSHIFTLDEAGSSHQILSTLGDLMFVQNFEGSLPSDTEFVFNEEGSPFYDPDITVPFFLVLMQPDMNRVVKIPIDYDYSVCCDGFRSEAPVYQDFSSGAATATQYETRLGFERRLVFTHPDEKRITVYPWPSP